MRKKFILVCFLSIIIIANAGWEIKEKSGDKELNVIIANNKMMIENENSGTVFDLEKEKLTFYNKEKKIYWNGTIEDFVKEMDEITNLIIEEQLQSVQAEYRELYRIVLKEKMEQEKKEREKLNRSSLNIEIKREGSKKKIAGMKSVKYEVYADGKKNREIWINENINLKSEMNIEKMKSFFKKYYEKSGTGDRVSFSPEVIGLWGKGMPMKSEESYDENNKQNINSDINFENIKIKEKSIDENEILNIEEYKKTPLKDF